MLSYGDANHPSAVTNHSTLNKNYSYDANGNMLTRGSTQTLTWDIDNRVSSVSITGGGTTSMEYDYSGMRVKKNAPSGTTLYPFSGYEIDPNSVITKFIRIGGESIASKKGTNKYFYHNDHLGSVNVITDINGTRVQLNEYDPWGAVSRAEGSIDPDQRFTGQKLDPETGLYYYGGRYYDAEIGRFISADPFVQTPYDPQNLNRYSYVTNNPQNYIDPDGYFHKPKKHKFPFWKKLFGFIFGPIAQAGFKNGIAGAAMELIKEVVVSSTWGTGFGWFFGAIFSGIQEEMFGTRGFGRGFTDVQSYFPWSSFGGGGGSGGGGDSGNDFPGGGFGGMMLAASNEQIGRLRSCKVQCYDYYIYGSHNPRRPDRVQIPFSDLDNGVQPVDMPMFNFYKDVMRPGQSLMIDPAKNAIYYQFNAGFYSSGTSTIDLHGILSKDLVGNVSFEGYVTGRAELYNFDKGGFGNWIGRNTPGRDFRIEWVGQRAVRYP